MNVLGTVFSAPQALEPAGHEQLTSITSATALTVPTGARVAVLQVEVAQARMRDDGTNPTTSVGMPIGAGETYDYVGDLSKVKLIGSSGTIVNVAYYK